MKKTQPTHTVYSMDSLYDGVVKQILVKNGEAVDFDQPIMIIE